MIYDSTFQLIGNTPAVRVHIAECKQAVVLVKLEGQNPTGSIKDRTCSRLIKDVVRNGALKTGMVLLDASSGNFGCALAYHAKLLNKKALVISSSKLTNAKRDFILYYGSAVKQIGDWTIEGNIYCQQLTKEYPDRFCFLDQLHNWENPAAHYETTGPEIVKHIPDLQMLVGSLGSGGSLLGVGRYIKEHLPHVLIVATQAASGSRIPGTASLDDGDYATPFIQAGFGDKVFDYTVKVSEREAAAATIKLRDEGIFCGLQTGGLLRAAVTIIQDLNIQGKVLLLSGDSGWKNMDKLIQTTCRETSFLDGVYSAEIGTEGS